MFVNLTPVHYLLMFLVIVIAAFILILLLPAIMELRKPKDAGPRKITEDEENHNQQLEQQKRALPVFFDRRMGVAPPEGLEPSTHELTARCSTELSYGGSINNRSGAANLRLCGSI